MKGCCIKNFSRFQKFLCRYLIDFLFCILIVKRCFHGIWPTWSSRALQQVKIYQTLYETLWNSVEIIKLDIVIKVWMIVDILKCTEFLNVNFFIIGTLVSADWNSLKNFENVENWFAIQPDNSETLTYSCYRFYQNLRVVGDCSKMLVHKNCS